MKLAYSLILICVLFSLSVFAQEVTIIPKPMEIEYGTGKYILDKKTKIYCSENSIGVAELFAEIARRSTGFPLPVVKEKKNSGITQGIIFVLSESKENDHSEAYTLVVTSNKIEIVASGYGGLLYGMQTLRQLLPAEIESQEKIANVQFSVPTLSIKDKPRFAWRGYMQDVSRTFYGVDVIKKYIDVMSLYKLNILHLHLTDDQGWRLEIKKYPKLTREKSTTFPAEFNQPSERSGYYTQDQIKDLVRYAAERNITIVPEVDIPGHCWPVLISYPELAVNNKLYPDYVFPFLASWGIWGNQFTPNTLDPTKEIVYAFLDDVFTEIVTIFPSPYIHFGGDEVKHKIWETEPHIKDFMEKHNMKSSADLQSYFVSRVTDIIKAKDRKPIGWNDVLKDSEHLTKETAIMSWLGSKGVKEATSKNFYTVATPTGYLYFDITQESRNDGTMSDLAYGNINSIDHIYSYDPTEGLTPAETSHVLGIQANQWTAIPQNVKDMNVQNFPRLLAVSEIGWTEKENKGFEDFSSRLSKNILRLDNLKMDHFNKGGYVIDTWSPQDISSEYKTLEWDVTNKVYANGRVIAGLFYTKGESFLNIRKMQLLENGKVISEDLHRGLADTFRGTYKTKNFLYDLVVDHYNKSSTYTLRVEVSGYNGTDSYGNVTFNLSPYKPFIKVETH